MMKAQGLEFGPRRLEELGALCRYVRCTRKATYAGIGAQHKSIGDDAGIVTMTSIEPAVRNKYAPGTPSCINNVNHGHHVDVEAGWFKPSTTYYAGLAMESEDASRSHLSWQATQHLRSSSSDLHEDADDSPSPPFFIFRKRQYLSPRP